MLLVAWGSSGAVLDAAAIHRAAGRELLAACRAVPEVRPGVRCPTGEARITPGYRLPARHVIYTVGPVYGEVPDAAALLSNAYRSCLRLANEQGFRSIAFPAISCGVYAYPLEKAAKVSIKACMEACGQLDEVHFVLFSQPAYSAWLEEAQRVLRDDTGSS